MENSKSTNNNYSKKSPLRILRQQSLNHKQLIRLRNKKVKSKKYLKHQLDLNHNVFQCSPASQQFFHRSMTLQNLLWDKNYSSKLNINTLKEENSFLKAQLWNISKENRKMNKQIQSWNLKRSYTANQPYIDAATFNKVISDQQYSIVTMKMQITNQSNILTQKHHQIQQLTNYTTNIESFCSHYLREIDERKINMLKIVFKNTNDQMKLLLKRLKKHLQQKIITINRQKDILNNNIQTLRKMRNQYYFTINELNQNLQNNQQLVGSKITYQSIDKINQEIKMIKNSCENDISMFEKQLQQAINNRLNYECIVQNQMGHLIKRKLQLYNLIQNQKIRNGLDLISHKPQKTVQQRYFGKMQIQLAYNLKDNNPLNFDVTVIDWKQFVQ